MGIAITQLVPTEPLSFENLRGKTLAVDGYNILYQFLTTIRGPDGSPLTNSKGDTTSHLIGLFSRTSNLLAKGIRLIFVFDGKIPDLKKQELQRRREAKASAQEKFEAAKDKEDVAEMKKFAGRTAKLSREMVEQAKELLDALGVPWMDAPSEGEAQAAALVKQGHAWAVVSQDADALLYEAPRIIKNLGITGRRKLPGKMAYTNVEPELITHKDVLKALDLDLDQLKALAILIGTDYNIGGVKGIGPKKGLKLIKEHDHDFKAAFEAANWSNHWDLDWKDVIKVFDEMPVENPEKLSFGKADKKAVEDVLVGKFEFSQTRVDNTIEKVLKEQQNTQTGLGDYF
ncbi:flap endonuclease-1 [Candidatus Woesearchaeota archaeon]|nr:flap endonuclease-1 [Candidatus Woesearchaeota archaeon]